MLVKSLHEQQLQLGLLDDGRNLCCFWQQLHLVPGADDADSLDKELEQLITDEADEQVDGGEDEDPNEDVPPLLAADCLADSDEL